MAGQCCVGGAASRRLARRISRAAASVLPGTALVLLPKCPLCLAAWLTAATGIGFSAAGAKWASATLVVFWIAALLLVAIPIVRRFSTSFRSFVTEEHFFDPCFWRIDNKCHHYDDQKQPNNNQNNNKPL